MTFVLNINCPYLLMTCHFRVKLNSYNNSHFATQDTLGPYKTASIAASPLLRLRRVNQKSAKIYYIKCKS